MLTPWGEALDRDHILQEYPRPQLRRESYWNLNGCWDFCITDTPEIPMHFDGEILVPFSPETVLSGASRGPEPEEYAWYRLITALPEGFRKDRLLLHFGAVDQAATVWVNGRELGTHVGGFTPFSMDITEAVQSDRLILLVRVKDVTNLSWQTRGKQRLNPGGIWYPPQSGIWQTVWIESVPEQYIRGLRLIPHYDEQKLELWVAGEGQCTAEFCGTSVTFPAGAPAVVDVPELHPWTPETPYLYALSLTLGEDRVESYFAMRKFSVETDAAGDRRLFLNNEPYFFNGVLDQGYWPDGLLTAPADAALIFDIQTAKDMGFNLLRKHMKVEPLRWYYHCDRLGMLVWQDMPCGGEKYSPSAVKVPVVTGGGMRDDHYAAFGRKDEAGRQQYYAELREMINALYNCPCVAMWVPFNEGWGQFDAAAVSSYIQKMDSSRLIDHASGWHDQRIGDIQSLHVYFRRYRHTPDRFDRAVILSEFGGYLHRIDGHSTAGKGFAYKKFDSANSYHFALRDLYRREILPAREEGLAAAVYTQLCDVESELNGLMTYDRRVMKIAPALMRNIVRSGE